MVAVRKATEQMYADLVTSARQQPTATIQALAYRAAEAASAAAKKGEL